MHIEVVRFYQNIEQKSRPTPLSMFHNQSQ